MKLSRVTSGILFASSVLAASLSASSDISKWIMPKVAPSPKENKTTPQRVELGKLLYFDARFSKSGQISCGSCHHPEKGWSDGAAKAVGVHGRVGPRNSPTVLNTGFQSHQFWDGRERTLEAQVVGPMQTGVEMDMKLEDVLRIVKSKQGYVNMFKKAYPSEELTITTVAKAIAAFERTIISQESPFDLYIKGNSNAISPEAAMGFSLFKGKAACTTCHDGFNFTDGSFHNIGLGDDDIGRQALKMKRKAWKGAMKTPTLRDITKSAPYFHDGSVQTLQEAVATCGNGGRYPDTEGKSLDIKNRNLSTQDIDLITEFLKSLTGPDLPIVIPTKFPN
ncbi:MAG: cytochrome c peroxidase [Campylobacterota bacterium]|nr:cytochrome c peroxidase [Campylobacterota bacterium]